MVIPPAGQVGGETDLDLGQGSHCLRHKLLRWRFDDDGRSEDPCPFLKGIWKYNVYVFVVTYKCDLNIGAVLN